MYRIEELESRVAYLEGENKKMERAMVEKDLADQKQEFNNGRCLNHGGWLLKASKLVSAYRNAKWGACFILCDMFMKNNTVAQLAREYAESMGGQETDLTE